MGMMTLLIASIIHLVVAAQVSSGSLSLASAETYAINLEAVRFPAEDTWAKSISPS